jgi:tetratricopeptide (TPR) repeat protein
VKEFLYFGELGPMGINRVAFAARMLATAGRIYNEMGQSERSLECFEKALRVLLETTLSEEEPVELPDYSPPVDEILAEVPVDGLNNELVVMLAFQFDRDGDLGRAEESIRRLLERNPEDPDIRETGRSFYEYLSETDPAELEAHRLSIETIRANLDGLR